MFLDNKKMLVVRFFSTGIVFLAVLLFISIPRLALSFDQQSLNKGIVIVRSYAGTQVLTVRNGLVVSADTYNGYVLTNADPLTRSETFTVLNPVSGAELIAQRIWADTRLDLAMFKVSGLNLPAIIFSKHMPGEGDPIHAVRKSMQGGEQLSFARGAIRRVYPYVTPQQTVTMMVHDAGVDEERGGILLVNGCSELVGFNLKGETNGLVRAITIASLRSVLGRRNINPIIAQSRCLSPVELARQRAELAITKAIKAEEDAAAARERTRHLGVMLEESRKLNKQLEAQTDLAQSRAEMAFKKADQVQAEIRMVREEAVSATKSILAETQALLNDIEDQRKLAEEKFQQILEAQQVDFSRREQVVYGILGVLTIGLVILVYLVRKRQQPVQEKQPETDAPSATILQKKSFAEYVLDGKDDTGIRYMLRISSDQLNTADGVVIGRNPTGSAYVINHADVSRNHARIRIMKNRLFIEDLQSTNGTVVNGQSISDRGLVAIGDGDQIIIGSIVMNLRVLQVA